MTAKRRPPDFEKSLSELEQLVARLEKGDLPLEESLRLFERGVLLTRDCQKSLTEAQAKVSLLSAPRDGSANNEELVDFDVDDDPTAPRA